MKENQTQIGTAIKSNSIVTQVVNQITDAIINGTLKPGGKLPTEPELCETFQVGRNSVREAIKILEAYGVVYIKRPEGTFVNDSYNQKMLDPMLYGILLQKDFTQNIIQLRKVLDIGILHTILPTITPEECMEIRKAFEDLKVAASFDNNCQKLMEADMAFHLAITRSSHNELLLSMYSYVDRITIPSRLQAITSIINKGESDHFIRLHQMMLNMVEQKETTVVEKIINEHYVYWKRTI